MSTRIVQFLSLAILMLLSGCVASTVPVGTKVAELKPAVWNAKWRGEDGSIVTTRIVDARLGRVEVTTKKAWLKPSEKVELLVRGLGPLTVVNAKEGDEYEFARVAINDNYLIFFFPSEPAFAELVRRHRIGGKIGKSNKWGDSCMINGFSETEFNRAVKKGFDPLSLFEPDPMTVWIRFRWMPLK